MFRVLYFTFVFSRLIFIERNFYAEGETSNLILFYVFLEICTTLLRFVLVRIRMYL